MMVDCSDKQSTSARRLQHQRSSAGNVIWPQGFRTIMMLIDQDDIYKVLTIVIITLPRCYIHLRWCFYDHHKTTNHVKQQLKPSSLSWSTMMMTARWRVTTTLEAEAQPISSQLSLPLDLQPGRSHIHFSFYPHLSSNPQGTWWSRKCPLWPWVEVAWILWLANIHLILISTLPIT